ncbi:MAG TPA: cupin domain-containing protein [bacterium]|nr:cupin domain-containing protein [bacterium]
MQLDTIPWRPTRYPGVAVHFYSSDERSKRVLALIRMAPGSGYPAHRHTGPEEVLVVRGGYEDELGHYRRGELVRYEAGTEHAPRATGESGGEPCVLLALAHEGVKLLG